MLVSRDGNIFPLHKSLEDEFHHLKRIILITGYGAFGCIKTLDVFHNGVQSLHDLAFKTLFMYHYSHFWNEEIICSIDACMKFHTSKKSNSSITVSLKAFFNYENLSDIKYGIRPFGRRPSLGLKLWVLTFWVLIFRSDSNKLSCSFDSRIISPANNPLPVEFIFSYK